MSLGLCIFYNTTATGWGIAEIEIEYMDGSFFTLNQEDVKAIK
jgi:hypothetical protein